MLNCLGNRRREDQRRFKGAVDISFGFGFGFFGADCIFVGFDDQMTVEGQKDAV